MRKTSSDFWEKITKSLEQRDLGKFAMVTGGNPEKLRESDENGLTVLHHLAINANAESVPALKHMIVLASKNGISKESLLNAQNRSGLTALTLCVTTENSAMLHARILLISELLSQGADPTLGNPGTNVLNRFSEKEKEIIQKDAILAQAVRACDKQVRSFALPKKQILEAKRETSLTKLSLACSSQQRMITPGSDALSPKIK